MRILKIWARMFMLMAFISSLNNGFVYCQDAYVFPSEVDEDKYVGVGINFILNDNLLQVYSVMEGSPASKAGVKAKDKIIKINEKSTEGKGYEESMKMLDGKAGEPLKLTVLRENKDLVEFTLVREVIKKTDIMKSFSIPKIDIESAEPAANSQQIKVVFADKSNEIIAGKYPKFIEYLIREEQYSGPYNVYRIEFGTQGNQIWIKKISLSGGYSYSGLTYAYGKTFEEAVKNYIAAIEKKYGPGSSFEETQVKLGLPIIHVSDSGDIIFEYNKELIECDWIVEQGIKFRDRKRDWVFMFNKHLSYVTDISREELLGAVNLADIAYRVMEADGRFNRARNPREIFIDIDKKSAYFLATMGPAADEGSIPFHKSDSRVSWESDKMRFQIDLVTKKFMQQNEQQEKIKGTSQDGQQVDPVIRRSYYPSTAVKIEMPYKDGKKEGVAKLYNEEGWLEAETPFQNNLIQGIAKNYDKNGKVISEERYEKGVQVSNPNLRVSSHFGLVLSIYFTEGRKKYDLNSDGVIDGILGSYGLDQFTGSLFYQNGFLFRHFEFDTNFDGVMDIVMEFDMNDGYMQRDTDFDGVFDVEKKLIHLRQKYISAATLSKELLERWYIVETDAKNRKEIQERMQRYTEAGIDAMKQRLNKEYSDKNLPLNVQQVASFLDSVYFKNAKDSHYVW